MPCCMLVTSRWGHGMALERGEEVPDLLFTQPMEGRGAEMDLLSGYPAEVSRTARTSRDGQRQRARDARIWRLLNDLQGTGGEVAKRILTMAVDRIHELCVADEKLRLLFDTLGDGVFGEIRQSERFVRESALEFCAIMLRLPSATPPREQQEGEDHHG